MITSAVFVPAVAQQTIFYSLAIFWEYVKDIFTCFVDLDKAYDQVPCKAFGSVA